MATDQVDQEEEDRCVAFNLDDDYDDDDDEEEEEEGDADEHSACQASAVFVFNNHVLQH